MPTETQSPPETSASERLARLDARLARVEAHLGLSAEASPPGVEVNYALDGDLSPEASEPDIKAIGEMARKIGIAVSGVCSFLYWPYALTANDPERRKPRRHRD